MRIKFHVTLKGKEADYVMKIVNAIGTTKEEFAEKAIVLMAQDIEAQVLARQEKEDEVDRQVSDNENENGEAKEVQPQSDSGENSPE